MCQRTRMNRLGALLLAAFAALLAPGIPAAGPAVAWGSNDSGQTDLPSSIDGTLGSALAVRTGYFHACAIRSVGRATVCWGSNVDGVSTPPTDVNGIKGRTTALSSLGSFNLALPGQALDADADGVVDIPDNCPSVPNGVDQVAIPDVGNQTDTDGDLVADACDNCRTIPNPRVAADFLINNPWATLTGGQRDDDQDGFGNACGADFTGTGALIGSGDLSVFRALRGKAAGPKCPTCPLPCSAGTAGSCF